MKRIIFLSILIAFISNSHAAVDKSGVKPNVLSLPSGPGSVEGLGESFEPQLNSGTATYKVLLAVPPGRAGFAPELALTYNSGNGNSFFGIGWKLDIPYIQRQTDKGLPYYTDFPDADGVDNNKDGQIDEADEFDTFIYSNGEELVPIADGSFRCENESDFIKFSKTSQGWTATRKDGTILRFGTSSATRIEDDKSRVFKWLLEEMSDTNGNAIQFFFEKKDTGVQKYCTKITYNPSADSGMTVLFEYEERPDIITDYRPRYELKTAFRCNAIRMMEGNQPVRSYLLNYEPTDNFQPLSLLSGITQIGRDGKTSLPPAEFTYVKFEGANAKFSDMPDAPKLSLNNENIDLIDLNADGLPDILDTSDNPHDYYQNLGKGEDGEVRWSSRTGMLSASLLKLGSDSTQLADMDGDGRTDLLNLFSTDVQFYRVGRSGAGFKWETGGYINQAEFAFDSPNVRLADLNNDKLIDVMKTNAPDGFAWLNLKDGKWSKAFMPALPNSQLNFDKSYIRLADMNGDRLQDILKIQNDLCSYYPGRGFGEFGSAVTMSNPPFGITNESRLLIADVNGDGMDDALYVGTATVKVWLNLGLNPDDHAKGLFADMFSVAAPYADSSTVFRQCDINGNGSKDILWNTHPGGGDETFACLDFVANEKPYQLKTITNGIGRTITICYSSSVDEMVRDREAGNPWEHHVPFPVPVVSKIELSDGLNTYLTEFQYHDGYYDGEEKEFRGFARAEQKEIGDASAPDFIMAYQFDTGAEQESLKGKPLILYAHTAGGEVFYSENYAWSTRELATGTDGDARKVIFPFQDMKTRDILEKGNGAPIRLKWEYEYDDYGNMTKQFEHGRVDEGWNDERVTVTSYTANYESGVSKWILDKIVESKTTDENGAPSAIKRNYYDGLALGEVSKGNLTKTEDWVEHDKHVVSVRNDYDEYGNVIATYDALYGTEPGHYRELVYDSAYHAFPVQEIIYTGNTDVPSLDMSATYDYGLGVMTSSTDFNGFTTSYDYDAFGRLISITKPPDASHTLEYDYVLAHDLENGNIVNWVETRQKNSSDDGFLKSRSFYDGLGRKIMTRAEGENAGQVVVTDTIKFNARKLEWKKYLPYFETGTLDFADPKFNTGFTEHFYDAMGREIRMNQPADPDGKTVFASTSYEPLSKTVQDEEQTNPDSPHYGCGMRYIEDGLQDKDGNGRLREVYEIVKLTDAGESGGLTEWLTSYDYDLLDNLAKITDSNGNQKFMEYDGLGRKTFMNDPDRGKMNYEYDDAGNLVKTADAKEQVIEYAYDGVNRLIAEYYGEGKTLPDVAYHYDAPFGSVEKGDLWQPGPETLISDVILKGIECDATCDLNNDGKIDVADVVTAATAPKETVEARNAKGFLSWVKDRSGEERNSYDERGRVEWVVKQIGEKNFFTAMEYDSMDRVTKLIYPDQSYITYTYNSRGLLESVPGVIERYDYNPSGQNAKLALACGAETSYSYDHRLRLERLYTKRTRDNLTLQDLNYAFDNVSNIVGIDDNRSDSTLDVIGNELGVASAEARKFKATQSFAYDSLYRLIQASNDSVYGAINYRYDRIGNMIHKSANLKTPDALMDLGKMTCGGSLGTKNRVGRNAGDAPGPHAVTGAEKGVSGPMTFEYDDNGNMISDNGMNLSWDYRDRLVSLEKGTTKADYVYDYSDTRKKKTVTDPDGSASEVLYIDKYSEIRNGGLIKYVYAGNSRIARAENSCGKNAALSPTAFYLHGHLGSASFALSDDGTVTEQLVNYPYGNPRLEKRAASAKAVADYKFTGKERDLESGLQYFEARYYSGVLGRFNRVDFLAYNLKKNWLNEPQKLNLYSYAQNNPIIYVDPNGLSQTKYIILQHINNDRIVGTLGIVLHYDKHGNRLGSYLASNTIAKSKADNSLPLRPGEYPYFYYNPNTQEKDINGRYGTQGNMMFGEKGTKDIGNHSYIGLHAGRLNKGGWSYQTLGCIRTTEESMSSIVPNHINMEDRWKGMTVEDATTGNYNFAPNPRFLEQQPIRNFEGGTIDFSFNPLKIEMTLTFSETFL